MKSFVISWNAKSAFQESFSSNRSPFGHQWALKKELRMRNSLILSVDQPGLEPWTSRLWVYRCNDEYTTKLDWWKLDTECRYHRYLYWIFKFMFQLTLFATCAIYAPIITISASILYHTNINKAILSNKWYSIIYCIFPFLCCAFLDIFCKKAVIHISYYKLWNSIPIVFIIQNVVIIIKRNISNLSQNNS
jgi:hypothetical protein